MGRMDANERKRLNHNHMVADIFAHAGKKYGRRGYLQDAQTYLDDVIAIASPDGEIVAALGKPPDASEEQMMEAVERFMAGDDLPEGFSVRPLNIA